jgi:hypothetical protein
MKSPTLQHHGWILADGHVHIHRQFQENICLRCALTNFARVATLHNFSGNIDNVLFLTESSNIDWFRRQHDCADKNFIDKQNGYQFKVTGETNSLYFEKDSLGRLFLIAGRQIITTERIEVLALGLENAYPDGHSLSKTLSDLQQTNSIIVIPWGVGKWLGKRGRIIASFLSDLPFGSFFLGDTGNRPSFWPLPVFFHPLGQLPPLNLPGSDPLPLANQENRIGKTGFFLQGQLDQQRPFYNLHRLITPTNQTIGTYGDPERLVPFLYNQTAMQLNKSSK